MSYSPCSRCGAETMRYPCSSCGWSPRPRSTAPTQNARASNPDFAKELEKEREQHRRTHLDLDAARSELRKVREAAELEIEGIRQEFSTLRQATELELDGAQREMDELKRQCEQWHERADDAEQTVAAFREGKSPGLAAEIRRRKSAQNERNTFKRERDDARRERDLHEREREWERKMVVTVRLFAGLRLGEVVSGEELLDRARARVTAEMSESPDLGGVEG